MGRLGNVWGRILFLIRSAGFIVALLFYAAESSSNAAERLELEVRESSGLARGGYPAHALLKLPEPVPVTTKFHLYYEGKSVVAQFRPDRDESTAQWWLDFQTEMKPDETKNYVVEFGDEVAAGPERPHGHKLTRVGKDFSIANAPYITWTVPHDLRGLLRSVNFTPAEFLRTDSPGLLLRDRQSREVPFSGTGSAMRQGPMAVALRFEKAESQETLRDVRSTIDLTFPAPVSWMELEWNIDDPLDNVAAVGLQLDLNLEKVIAASTLVDFGATSAVYTSLRLGQEAELIAGPGRESNKNPLWQILRRDQGRVTPFASAPKRLSARQVEGWAHVMDRKICLALAIEAFARDARDRLNVTADGSVTFWREYEPAQKAKPKRLRLWLHFVHFPPQATAGASPQQMQTPLEVRLMKP